MRRLEKLLSSLIVILICVLIGAAALQSKQLTGIKSTISQVVSEAKQVISSAVNLITNDSEQSESNTSGKPAEKTKAKSGTPAIPVESKITSAPASDDAQSSVTEPVAAATLNSVWGETGMKGLTVYEYGKTLLNSTEKSSYCNIADAVRNVEPQLKVKTVLTPTQIKKVYEYYIYDHSDIFYIEGVSLVYYQEGNEYAYTFSFEYKYGGDKAKINTMRSQIRTKALQMLSAADGKSTDLKKEKALHDVLIKQCSYDLKAAQNQEAYPDSFSVYGALVNNKAVCQGYAQTMKLLLSSVGIKTLYITGQANGGGHAWNMVQIGGKWRYLDATFDDPVYYNSKGDYTSYSTISYTYFNYTSKDDRTIGTFDSANPFSGTSENYATMPKVN
jgi:hypothetical protein